MSYLVSVCTLPRITGKHDFYFAATACVNKQRIYRKGMARIGVTHRRIIGKYGYKTQRTVLGAVTRVNLT